MAVAVDSQEASNAGHRITGTGVNLTWSFTNTGGTLAVIAIVGTQVSGGSPAVSIDTVTYNSVAFTLVGSVQWGSNNADIAAIYYLLNPATGSNTVSVVTSGAVADHAKLAGMVTFTGAHASAPFGTPVTATGSSAAASTAAITAASGGYIIGVGGQGSGNTMAPSGGFSETWELVGSALTAGDNAECVIQAGTGAALTPGFTWSGSDSWGMVAVEILQASSGGNLSVGIGSIGEPVVGGSTF